MVLHPPSGTGPRHVDRKALYTDLEARVRYLQQFLGFNADDVVALNQGSKYIKAMAPTLVDRVYAKLLEADITARVFKTRSTTSEDYDSDYPEFKSPYIQCRRMFLRWYLTKLCSDPTKLEFYAYLNKVGRMHDGKDRMIAFDVEYIHIGACLGYIQDMLIEAVMGYDKISFPLRLALMRALSKVIWIQNDLFARWRVRDGAEFEAEIEAAHQDRKTEPKTATDKPAQQNESHDRPGSAKTGSSSWTESTSVFSEAVSAAPTSSTASTQHASPHHSICPFSHSSSSSFETKVWSGPESSGGSRSDN